MGSLPRPPSYLIGRRFGRLMVSDLNHVAGKLPGRWRYEALVTCDCGTKKTVRTEALVRGATTSCGCNKERYVKTTGANNLRFRGCGEIRMKFWQGYIVGARARGLSFDIKICDAWELFLSQSRKCAFTGIQLVFGPMTTGSVTTASLDRIDNAVGYTLSNVQWVHKRINLMRHTLSIQEFVDLCRMVTEHSLFGIEVRDVD